MASEHVIEHLAGVEDFQLAMATYRANDRQVRDAESFLSVLVDTLKGFERHRRAILGRLGE